MNMLNEEQLSDGVTYKIFEDDIHYFYATNLTRDTVDIALDKSAELDRICFQNGKKRKAVYVFEHIYFTPYMLKKLIDISRDTPDELEEYNAIVGDGLLIRMFETTILKQLTKKADQSTRLFSNEQDALAWLQSC